MVRVMFVDKLGFGGVLVSGLGCAGVYAFYGIRGTIAIFENSVDYY